MKNNKSRNFKICNLQFAICNSGGFTLLEIMIALAIIGIALTVLIHTVNYHSNIMYDNILSTQMFQLAKEKINEMEMNPQDSKGEIGITGFKYKNTVSRIEDSNVVELKTVVTGHGKEVTLSELIVKKE
jgi:prepilin-type N-terminal cleavage/methylation domain-containing protein